MTTNNIVKVLLVVIIISFVISGVMFGRGNFSPFSFWWRNISFGNHSYDDLEDVDFDNSYSSSEFEQINIKAVSADCRLIAEDRSDIRVTYQGKGEFSADLRGNELDINESFSRWKLNNIRSGSLTVYIPEDFDKDVEIYCVSGEIEVADFISSELTLETISGSIEVNGVESQNVKVKSISGRLEAQEISFNNADFDTVSGRITIAPVQDWSEIDARSISGSINLILTEDSEPSVTYKSVSGDLRSEVGINSGKNSDQTVNVRTTSGDIIIKKAD